MHVCVAFWYLRIFIFENSIGNKVHIPSKYPLPNVSFSTKRFECRSLGKMLPFNESGFKYVELMKKGITSSSKTSPFTTTM